MKREKNSTVGQSDIFGKVDGISELVKKPKIIEENSLRVIHFTLPENRSEVPGYLGAMIENANKLQPKIKSSNKPVWLDANWQMNRRKKRASG